ncbi:MAG: hypothetical protein WCG91_01250 [Candidatus Shapirobacteria bacterium]
MFKALQKYKFFILIALFFLLLRIPSLFEPAWYGDEGIYLTIGEGLNKGLNLYTQIHDNKPPTLYFLAAISHTVFGFRLLLLLSMAITVYCFNLLAKKFLEPKIIKIALILFVFLTSIPFIEGTIANAEIFMLLPTILGVLIFLNAKKTRDYFLSAFILGLAFTIKMPVLFECIFLTIFLALEKFDLISRFNLKNIFSKRIKNIPILIGFLISFSIPILAWGIYYYFHQALSLFISASLMQNFSYLSSWSTGNQSSSLASGGLINRLIILILAWLVIYVLLIKKVIDKKIAFLLFWFGTTIFAALLSGRPYPHYLIQTLPSLCLVIGAIFSKSYKIIAKAILVLSVAFLVFVFWKFNFYSYPTTAYYKNFYSYALGQKSQANYYSFFGSGVQRIYDISNYVKENTAENEKIFLWGDESFIYSLSDRLPVGRFTVAYHIVDFNAYNVTISQLKNTPPKLIIYYQMNGRPFQELDNLIKEYYYPAKAFDSVIIYKLK